MKFFTISDKYSSAVFGYSVMGFYISIVYLIGKLFRMSITGSIELIPLMDMPNPDNLLRICEAMIVARVEKDLKREEMLYFELIDLIRSAEILKHITGSNIESRRKKL